MTASIIRDSLALFLLIYAVIDLGHRIILFALHAICKSSKDKNMFFVIDATQMTSDTLEYHVRSALLRFEEPIIVLGDTLSDEASAILDTLGNEHDALHMFTKSELAMWLTYGTSPAVFLNNIKTEAPSHSK